MSSHKLLAASIVVESDKLTKSSKHQLLNFLENASDIQIKSFLLDGSIIEEPDEMTQQIIEDRFNCSPLSKEVSA